MAEKIRWGILSTGHISGRFAEALSMLPEAENPEADEVYFLMSTFMFCIFVAKFI